MKKHLGRLALFAACVLTAAFTSSAITFVNTQRIGPFYTSVFPFDSTAGNAQGGYVTTYLAGDSEWVGNISYISAKNTVKMDTLITHYNNPAGVVVGGTRNGMRASGDSADVGTLAAIAGQRVLVLVRGRTYVTIDSVGGYAPGLAFTSGITGTNRGKAKGRTTAIDSFNRIIGHLIDTGVVNTKRLAIINIR